MTQSRNFGFGQDEEMLRDSARKFFADNCPPDRLHAQVARDYHTEREFEAIWDQDLWRQIVELGWPAVCIPEDAGGIGMPVVAAVALAEEAGKAAFPSPLIATFNSVFVLRECGSPAATEALAQIATGKPMTLAITDANGSWEPGDTDVRLENGKLHGQASFVQEAFKAESFIVSARTDDGVGLYLIEAGSPGVKRTPDRIVDLTRDQGRVSFDGADATELAAPGTGAATLERAMPAILCMVSADMVGAGEWLLQTTAEYAKTRVQFDRPLGFFQAVKHPLVNVMLEIDRARSLTYNAACTVDEEPDEALKYARMAKSAASDMAVFSSSRAVQFHGGIGFTWEAYVHIFFKRQMHNHVLYGDGKYQRSRLADMMMGAAA